MTLLQARFSLYSYLSYLTKNNEFNLMRLALMLKFYIIDYYHLVTCVVQAVEIGLVCSTQNSGGIKTSSPFNSRCFAVRLFSASPTVLSLSTWWLNIHDMKPILYFSHLLCDFPIISLFHQQPQKSLKLNGHFHWHQPGFPNSTFFNNHFNVFFVAPVLLEVWFTSYWELIVSFHLLVNWFNFMRLTTKKCWF